ncbi:MAG: hypothetical protein M5R36_16985 [Deltaproteobacteria bacterium]|nr:hypothetical protein [Deltaproteobacteria bacterium]
MNLSSVHWLSLVLLLTLALVGCGCGDKSTGAGADSDDDESPSIDDDSGIADDDTSTVDDDQDDDSTGTTTTTVTTTTSTTSTTIAHTEDCTPSWITPVQLPDPTTFPIDPPYQDGDVVRRQYFAATAGNTGIDIAVEQDGVAHIATMLGTVLEHIAVHPDGHRTQEMIDKDGAREPKIQIDRNGNVHVLYQAFVSPYYLGDNDIRYASNIGGTWSIETFDSFYTYGDDVSAYFTLDAEGEPHAVYRNASEDVFYAHRSSRTWSIETMIPEDGRWHSGFSLAFDADDVLHVLHNEPDSTWHRWNDGTGWQAETISTQWPYSGTSLAIDAAGNLHGTYALYGSSSLAYVTNEGGTWDEFVVDWCGGDADGDDARLMVDSAGAAHIVYADTSLNGIRYATNASGTWEIHKFSPAQSWDGWFVSAAMGPDDAMHVVDYNEDESSLFYRTNASGEWTRQRIAGLNYIRDLPVFDSSGNIHTLIAPEYDDGVFHGRSDDENWEIGQIALPASGGGEVAVGPDGEIHALFQSDDYSTLFYAENLADALWNVAILDDGGEVEPTYNLSIAFDALGQPRVAYHKESPEDHVVYVERNEDLWHYDQIDPPASVGDLLVGDDGRTMMFVRQRNYPDSSKDRLLLHTRLDGGDWLTETIVNDSRYGRSMSMALGPAGEPRVLFYDRNVDAYIYYRRPESGSWEEMASFDYDGGSFTANDLVIGDDGYSHLLFYSNNMTTETRGLVCATDASGTWKTRIVDADVDSWTLGVSLFVVEPNVFRAAYRRVDMVTEGSGTFMTEFSGGVNMP